MLSDKLFWIGCASVVLNCIGYFPYIRSVIRGTVKPQRVSWLLWTILVGIAFVNQVANGGGYSAFFIGSTFLLVVTVFGLSFSKGVGGGGRLDKASLMAAAVLFVCWAITRDTRLSTIIAVTIDGVGAIPTAYKAWLRPETEAYLQWITSGMAALLSLLAISTHDYILWIYPLYVVVANGLIVAFKYSGTVRARQRRDQKITV
jgi:hypothetical protein